MKKFLKAFRYGERGFTLIELLIVVAILGILAAVIIPNVSSFLTTGTLNAANTEAENVKTAVLAFYAEKNSWPANSEELGLFLTGAQLKALYTFDADGFISSATPHDYGNGLWTGIEWSNPGSPGTGKWIRATSP